MNNITLNGKKLLAEDCTLEELMQRHSPCAGPGSIILAGTPTKIRELFQPVEDGMEIETISTAMPAGQQAYQRTAVLMMLKAFYSAAGQASVDKVTVDFYLGDALYIRPEGSFTLNDELLMRVEKKMRKYQRKAYPIVRSRMLKSQAIARFARHGMDHKARLFRYRLSSYIHVYSLGQFDDSFYGYMAPNCSYIDKFRLIPWKDGFFLQLPSQEDPDRLADFDPAAREKMFNTLKESNDWACALQCEGVADLNDIICRQKGEDLVLIQEALQEKKIGQIAEQIAQSGRKLVMIAGPSSSSKTTFARRLCVQLRALGLNPLPISADDYYVNRENSPRNPDGSYNFEALECLDLPFLNGQLSDLLAGKKVDLPVYNFTLGRREFNGQSYQMKEDDILVIEGIHCLNDKMSYALPADKKFRIYISALSQLGIDEHNPIQPSDGRLLRRIVRDARSRGASAQTTIEMWPGVRKGEEENIFPYEENADVLFNSACVYELAVLKQYAEPLLFAIGPESPAYLEAQRLLKFLDYFLAIDAQTIPKNSLVREFIG